MKMQDLLLLGALGIGAYFIWKQFNQGGETPNIWGDGAIFPLPGPETIPGEIIMPEPEGNITKWVYAPDASKKAGEPMVMPVFEGQGWTNTTYGEKGQPSTIFARNTIAAAKSPTASIQTKTAAAAIRAGAPPRIAAKIKAGKVF